MGTRPGSVSSLRRTIPSTPGPRLLVLGLGRRKDQRHVPGGRYGRYGMIAAAGFGSLVIGPEHDSLHQTASTASAPGLILSSTGPSTGVKASTEVADAERPHLVALREGAREHLPGRWPRGQRAPRRVRRLISTGHVKSAGQWCEIRAKKICDALGLDLNVGSPHESATRGQVHPSDVGRLTRTVSRELERHTQGLVRVVAAAGGDPIPPEMRAGLGHGPRGRDDPRKTPVSQTVETETAAVVVPFAANVRFAESDEPVWEETAEMAVSVARSALASWARPERLRCARVVDDSMAPLAGSGATPAGRQPSSCGSRGRRPRLPSSASPGRPASARQRWRR